ncbi:O-antigen ligase family protein [Patescibacteria group bacterium]
MTLQAAIGIIQYVFQKSIGLKILFESQFDASTPNIAKLDFNGEEIIRAYGTVPHSNILGGFLVASLLITLFFIFYVNREKIKNKRIYLVLLFAVYFIQFSGLILSYSRSAWLAFGASLVGIIVVSGLILWKNKKISLKKVINKRTIAVFVIILISSLAVISIDNKNVKARLFDYTNIAQEENIDIRNSANDFALGNSSRNIFGKGIRSFIPEYTLSNPDLPQHYWQPAHSIYNLVAFEMGTVGMELLIILFLYAIVRAIIKSVRRGYLDISIPIIIALITIGFFDHYLWTLQQGQLILWVGLGLLFATNKGIKANKNVPRGTSSS